MGRLAWSLALALGLALCGGTLCGLGGQGRSTAWAGATGWVLHYVVYDRDVRPRDWKLKLPHEQGFSQAVQDWAQDSQIKFSDKGWIDAPRFIGLHPGGSSGAFIEGTEFNSYSITLIGVTAGEREALIAQLAPLPGVAPPEISDYTEFYVLAGTPKAQVPQRVLINGKAYAFPQDFTLAEVNALQQYFQYGREYTRYVAFPVVGPRSTAEQDRFELGDVVRFELDPAGDLVVTTLAEVWDEGRVLQNDPLFQEQVGNRGQGSWSVVMSRNLPEPGYDPLQALASRRDRLAEQAHSLDYPQRTAFSYQFFPAERMLNAGAPKYTAEEAAQAAAWVAQLDAGLDAFQSTHPQYWNKFQHRYRVQHGCSYFGAMPLQYQVNVAASDTTLAQEVQAVLAAVQGLPEVQVTQRDLREESKVRQQQVAPPFTGDTFTMPPLPPPNPAQWHAMEGYKLTYRVLGCLAEGQRYFGETNATREFSHAVAQWATAHGVPVNPQPTPIPQPLSMGLNGAPATTTTPGARPFNRMQFPDVALYMAEPGGGGQFDRFTEAVFTLYFAAAQVATVDSLSAALEALPGVAAPQVEACRFYIHDSHPGQPVTGGDLLVDGRRYRFPDDFAWEEALSLGHRWSAPGMAQYVAFYTLVDPQRNRIKFPDVARRINLVDGTTVLTTFKENWPEGRKLLALRPNVYGGDTAELPPGIDENSFDPLPALAQRLAYTQPAVPGARVYHLIYYIVPQDQWLEVYKSADSAQIAARREVCAEVDRRLEDYLKAHPEYKQTASTWQRFGNSTYPYHGRALGLDVYAYGDDDALARELAALLADIPGLPAPVQTQEEITTF